MAVRLVLGSSGAGKSHLVYTDLIQRSVEEADGQFFVIVPEQFTMQTQKQIVSMHPNHGTMNIDIVSFVRLSYRIFDELNYVPKDVLEDVGKSMVVRRIMEEKKEELLIFAGSRKKAGFVDEVKSLLSEFYQYCVTAKDVGRMQDSVDEGSMLYGKLHDMKEIYESFEAFMQQDFLVAEQLLTVLAEKVRDSEMIRGSVICIDGFTGFTPVQYQLLAELFREAKEVVITVTIDPENLDLEQVKEYELFQLSKHTIRKIKELAQETERKFTMEIAGNGQVPVRFRKNKEMAALSKNLFRFPFEVYDQAMEAISIHAERSPREEAFWTARLIRKMVGEGRVRYRDVAIVTGALETYEEELGLALSKLSVPFFMDSKKSILNNPCIECLRAVLDLIQGDFAYEKVFRYLKTGMSALTKEEVDLLENYVIAAGIRGYRRWNRPFGNHLRRLSENRLAYLNGLREQVLTEVEPLYRVLKKKEVTVRESVEALFYFMRELQLEEKLIQKQQEFEQQGERVLQKAYGQIYDQILHLFDKMVEILGKEKMPLEEWIAVLEEGLNETEIGVIPPGMDQVLVGDIERTRLNQIKVLFFVGVNEGIIPKGSSDSGVMTDMERELLLSSHFELAPTAREHTFTEQFYLYWNLTKPEEALYLSYSKVDMGGKSVRPSYLIGRLTRLFPELRIEDGDEVSEPMERVYTPEDSVDYLIEGMRNYLNGEEEPVWEALFTLFQESEEARPILQRLLLGAFHQNSERPLSKAIAKALYGDHMGNSVTRLEKYAACAFAHFLRYGLELTERQEYTVRSMDMGNVFHKTIELFSKAIEESDYDWTSVPAKERDEMADRCVESAVAFYNQELFHDSARNQYMITTITRIVRRTIWALQEHVRRGNFAPKEFELSFGNYKNLQSARFELKNGSEMNLSGVIDRVDTYEDDSHIYLKVIDYKSGNTAFDIVDLYYGLQIQLIVYLNAAMELTEQKAGGKAVIPAGVFYYNIKDPMINVVDEEERELALLKEMKMNGIANSDPEVLDLLEKDSADRFVSIPVTPLKKGGFSKWSKVASTENLKEVGEYVSEKIKEIGNEMMDGNISIAPYSMGNRTACDYCEYRQVCGFDPKDGMQSYRRLKNLETDEVWAKMEMDLAKCRHRHQENGKEEK